MKKQKNEMSNRTIIIEPEYEIIDNMEEIEELSEEINKDKQKEENKKMKIVSNIATVCITITIVSLLMVFVGQFVLISGESMMPNFSDSDIVFVEKISDKFERFDVITVTPKKLDHIIVKRVIGVPGDTIQIIDGNVYVNDKRLEDIINTKIEDAGIAISPIVLNKNEYFVLGDNRNNSYDSRFENVGIISSDDVFGKVLFTLP